MKNEMTKTENIVIETIYTDEETVYIYYIDNYKLEIIQKRNQAANCQLTGNFCDTVMVSVNELKEYFAFNRREYADVPHISFFDIATKIN